MSKSSGVYTRVEPELKAQVEQVLLRLGIPMSNAIYLFLNQIVLQNGIPFDVKLPQSVPLNYSMLSKQQFDLEIEKGLDSLNAGRTVPSGQVRRKIQGQSSYDLEN